MGSIKARFERLISAFAVVTVAMATVIVAAPQAQAAVAFSIKPLTWDVIGLDSNKPATDGPDLFPVAARACNTGTTQSVTVTAQLIWDSANANIFIQAGSQNPITRHYMAPGACSDFYFNVQVTRSKTATYDTTRQYHILVTGDGGVTAQTPAGRQLYVEHLVSQSRNSIASITGPTTVYVGGSYTYTVTGSTAPGGYEQLTTYLNFPNVIFRLDSMTASFSVSPAAPNPTHQPPLATQVYHDACGWDPVPTSPTYRSCVTYGNDKIGADGVTTLNVTILSPGVATMTALWYDFSGSSYHYNNDLGIGVNSITVTALAPTAATFGSARATGTPDGGAAVEWTTATETDNLGFNVYAADGDQKVKLNEGLIAGSALATGAVGPDVGRAYRWAVPPSQAPPSDEYWVEAVDLNGESTWHGPVKVDGTSPSAVRSSAPLSALGGHGGRSFAQPRVSSGAPSDRTVAASLASSDAVKIGVNHEGWYRVPFADLTSAGMAVGDSSGLRLYAEGVEQPIEIRDSAVEFYGLGLDTASTDTRVYWLTGGAPGGARVASSDPPAGASGPGAYPETVVRQDRSLYFSALTNGDAGNFFGAPVTAAGVDQTLTADALATAAGATLQANLQGVSAGAHSVSVELNGNALGNVAFADKDQGSVTFPATGLVDGDNTVRLTSSGSPDVSVVGSLKLDYERNLVARDGSLRFTAAGGTSSTVLGFASDGVRVLDVTDPQNPVELATSTSPDGGGFDATVTAAGVGQRTLYAFASPQSPDSLAINQPSRLLDPSNGAGMLIVSPQSLMSSMRKLAAYHKSHGLKTRVVDVTDVYDEFGSGEEGAQALKDFLAYAHSSWRHAPRYVLLAGDGSLDPRGFMGPSGTAADQIPVKLVDTKFMETASDPWFADVNGDMHPDFALGRFPVRTPAQADALVAKTIAYGSSTRSGSMVVATDQNDLFDFAEAGRSIARLAPGGTDVTTVNRSRPNARAKLLSAIDAGPSVVNYIGHGSVGLWRGGFFDSSDAAGLANTSHPAFFIATTCLNGYFQDPNLDSLSEAMLKAPGGAVVAWSSTGMTYPTPQIRLNQALYGSLSSAGDPTIGSAVMDASGSVRDADVLKTWTLLGDPAVVLR